MTIEFEIDALPKMPNQLLGSCWQARASHAKKWKQLVMIHTNQFKPNKPLTSAALTLVRMSSVQSDFDNLTGSFKAVIDALVHCGILSNDTPEVIGHPTYEWKKVKRGHGGILVRIESHEVGAA